LPFNFPGSFDLESLLSGLSHGEKVHYECGLLNATWWTEELQGEEAKRSDFCEPNSGEKRFVSRHLTLNDPIDYFRFQTPSAAGLLQK
jgi:hypothetical protein